MKDYKRDHRRMALCPILISFVVDVIRSVVTPKGMLVNPFQSIVTFLIETSHLICTANL